MRKIIKELSAHSIAYFVGSVAISASSILLLPLYTRYLAKADYGAMEIIDSINSLMMILFLAGLGPAFGKFHNESADEAGRRQVFGTAFWFVLATATLGTLILASFRGWLTQELLGSQDLGSLMGIGLANMWLNPVFVLCTYYLNVNKMVRAFLVFSLSKLIINVIFNLFFIVHLSYGAKGMLLGELFSTILVGGVLLWTIVARNGLPFRLAYLRSAMAFGLPFVPALLCAALMHRADRYLIQNYLSLAAVGVYSVGYKLPFMLGSLLQQSFGRIWGSTAQFEIAKQKDWQLIYARVTTYFFTVIVLAEFSLAILSTTLLRILTVPAYYEAAPVIQVLAAGVCIYSLHNFFSVAAVIKNKTWYLPIAYFAAAATTLSLDIFLLPRFGFMVAAWATVASYTVLSALIYLLLNRFYPIPFEFRRMSMLFLAALGLLFLNNAWHPPGEALEALKQVFLIVVLVAFILFGPFLKSEEVGEIVRFASRFLPRTAAGYARIRRVPLEALPD